MAFTFNNDYSPQPPDEISLFLRQLLSRSSSSSLPDSGQINVGLSSSFEAGPNNVAHIPGRSDSDRTELDRVPETFSYPNAGWSEIPASVCSNLTSPSIAPVDSDSHLRATENDADDYDCDSEEGAEANKQNQVRNSCKRSRAAEVHNMSEKRRRSRINEKMKALQNLIPNSNKTDKASMLDDAIEYLKQLQLQVQMLTMRNGLIMHQMSLPGFPGVFDPVQIPEPGFNFSNVDGSLHPTVLPSGRPKHLEPLANQQLDSLAGGVTEEAPFPLDNQISSFRLPASSQSFSRDDTTTQHQLSEWASQKNALESMDPMLSSASKHSSLSSYLKDDAQEVLLTNRTSHIQLISNNLDGLYPGATTLDEI